MRRDDQETVSQIAGLLSDALEEPKLKAALGGKLICSDLLKSVHVVCSLHCPTCNSNNCAMHSCTIWTHTLFSWLILSKILIAFTSFSLLSFFAPLQSVSQRTAHYLTMSDLPTVSSLPPASEASGCVAAGSCCGPDGHRTDRQDHRCAACQRGVS